MRENQLNVDEFKKFKVAARESSIRFKEDSYDQMLLKDLVQKFLLQQKNNVKHASAESDSQVVHSSGLTSETTSSSAEGAISASSARPSDVLTHSPPGLPQPQSQPV